MSGQPGNCTKLYPYILNASPRNVKYVEARKKPSVRPERIYSKQVMVFPLGIVNKYDVPELQECVNKQNKQSCELPRGTMRWGTQFLISQKNSHSIAQNAQRKTYATKESKPSVRVNYPQVKKISVKAITANLNERPSTAPSKCVTEQPKLCREESKDKRIVRDIDTVAAKNKIVNERQKLLYDKQEIKIENGVIMIENGRFIDLHEKSFKPNNKSTRSNSYSELKSSQQAVQLLDDAMIRLSDAKSNLEQEIRSEAKTIKTRAKESEFFDQHVKTEFLELFKKVRRKRVKTAQKSKKRHVVKKCSRNL